MCSTVLIMRLLSHHFQDNVHASEVTLHDLNVIHDGTGFAGPLRIYIGTAVPRFITRFRSLQEQLARVSIVDGVETGETENEEQSRPDELSGSQAHAPVAPHHEEVGVSYDAEHPEVVRESDAQHGAGEQTISRHQDESRTEGEDEEAAENGLPQHSIEPIPEELPSLGSESKDHGPDAEEQAAELTDGDQLPDESKIEGQRVKAESGAELSREDSPELQRNSSVAAEETRASDNADTVDVTKSSAETAPEGDEDEYDTESHADRDVVYPPEADAQYPGTETQEVEDHLEGTQESYDDQGGDLHGYDEDYPGTSSNLVGGTCDPYDP